MRNRGWVYVMTNKAMPGLVKVGASGKDPFERAKELRGTGSPYEFVVEYDVLVFDPFALEKAAHDTLAAVRVNGGGQGTEFFRCSVEDAIAAVRALIREMPLPEAFHKVRREYFDHLQDEANRRAQAERHRKEVEAQAEQHRQENEERARLARVTAEKRAQEERAQQEEAYRRNLQEKEARLRLRQEWLSDQESRIRKSYKNRTVAANALKMLAEGRFFICAHCGRPCVFNYPVRGNIACDGCRKVTGVP